MSRGSLADHRGPPKGGHYEERCTLSPKQILIGPSNELPARPMAQVYAGAAHERDGHTRGLLHNDLGRRRELVGERDDRDLQPMTVSIEVSAVIDECLHARHTQ